MNRDEFEQQWLAELPESWQEKRADFLCDSYRVTVDPEVYGDDPVAHYSIPQVQATGGPAIEPASDIDSSKLLITAPTLLVSKLNPRKSTVCVAVPDAGLPTLASGEFVAIRSDKIDQKYAYYLWSSAKVTDRLSAIVHSVTRSHQRVNPADITKLPWKWPPLETQRRIARFLDAKTARIDALIAKKRALLERLAEKRQALITQAVTKGLDPSVPMKDSGIDWLGQIPAHWEVLPLRRVTLRVATGRTPPTTQGDYFTDGEVNWYTPGDFGEGAGELGDSERKITQDALNDGVGVLFPAGAVMLVAIGATLGKVAVAISPASANQQINAILLEPGNDAHYFAYLLHGFRNEVRVMSNANTLGILNQGATKALPVLRPPAAEQKDIAKFLVERDVRLSVTVRRIRHSLDLLTEHRAALITAAVTGRLETPAGEPSEPPKAHLGKLATEVA